jgi:hypothetical protein
LLAAGFAPAQDQPDPGVREQQEPTYEGPSVLSRENAFGTYEVTFASSENFTSPVVPDPQEPDYDGPSILSRGNSLPPETKSAITAFGLYAQIIGIYDSGLMPVSAAPGKPLTAIGSFGEQTDFGVNASHRGRRGKMSVDYRGSFLRYTNAPQFDGLDQFLQVAYSEAPMRHLILDVKSTLGSTTLANGAFSYFPLASLDRIGIPTGELFDNRTNYMQSRVDLTWRLTPRLSFDFGGDGFVVRRQSLLLAGLNGYSARASAAYRLTARQTLSASYDNTYFDFQRAFGNSRLATMALGYSVRLTREWDLSTLAGGVRVAVLGLTQVPLDPAIAALTGQSFAVVTFSNVLYLPVAEVRLVRRFKTASLTFDYTSNVTPGNGLYLTSRQTSGEVAYLYTATRNLQGRANAGYNQLSALGQALGKYSNLQGGLQLSYRLTGETYVDVRYDYRHYTTQYTTGDTFLDLDSNRVSVGVRINLGETSGVTW